MELPLKLAAKEMHEAMRESRTIGSALSESIYNQRLKNASLPSVQLRQRFDKIVVAVN